MTKSKYGPALRWGIFAAYSVLTLLGALNHEVWLDEAQAWVIVRDAPLSELPHILKAEGHPPLWYIILYPFVKLGFPPEFASLISWAFMAAGALVLLFKVELPLPLKSVILASSGFLYFNSVMLRVYCVIPLLLFLILWVYPKRRERAVLYGLLIALLANTHIFICGIVGILGLFMLYELFSEWKRSSRKENAGKLIGLAVAGAGVLILVIPLIGSIEANGVSSLRMRGADLAAVGSMLTQTFHDAFSDIVFLLGANSAAMSALCFIADLGLVMLLILLRHWRRALAVVLGFMGIYYITCGLVWISLPNRAVFFILSFAFALCLTHYETPVFKDYRLSEKITGNIRKLLEFLKKTDKNAARICTVIITAFFAVSVPSGVYLYCRDMGGNYCGAKEMAEYITENFDDDAVFVQLRPGLPEVSFYAPDIKIFAAAAGDLTTYARWENMYRPRLSAPETLDKLAVYDELYIIYYCVDTDDAREALYIADGMRECTEKSTIAIREYDAEEVASYINAMGDIYEQTR